MHTYLLARGGGNTACRGLGAWEVVSGPAESSFVSECMRMHVCIGCATAHACGLCQIFVCIFFNSAMAASILNTHHPSSLKVHTHTHTHTPGAWSSRSKSAPPPHTRTTHTETNTHTHTHTHTHTRTHTHTHTHTRTHAPTHKHTNTRATASAHVPGAVRWRHELVVGPARREQVEGNDVRNSIIGRVR